MPEQIHGKKLSKKRHRQYRHVVASMKKRGHGKARAHKAAMSATMKSMGLK